MIHHQKVRLDLNNPEFQGQWFALAKDHQMRVLANLRKLSEMTWNQVLVYDDKNKALF